MVFLLFSTTGPEEEAKATVGGWAGLSDDMILPLLLCFMFIRN